MRNIKDIFLHSLGLLTIGAAILTFAGSPLILSQKIAYAGGKHKKPQKKPMPPVITDTDDISDSTALQLALSLIPASTPCHAGDIKGLKHSLDGPIVYELGSSDGTWFRDIELYLHAGRPALRRCHSTL